MKTLLDTKTNVSEFTTELFSEANERYQNRSNAVLMIQKLNSVLPEIKDCQVAGKRLIKQISSLMGDDYKCSFEPSDFGVELRVKIVDCDYSETFKLSKWGNDSNYYFSHIAKSSVEQSLKWRVEQLAEIENLDDLIGEESAS